MRQTSMPRAVFEPAITVTKRPQTYTLDCAATGICTFSIYVSKNIPYRVCIYVYDIVPIQNSMSYKSSVSLFFAQSSCCSTVQKEHINSF
jgi:hypothetical protein